MVYVQRPKKIMNIPVDETDTPTDTQILKYDETSNKWKAEDA